jgi:hypothetical protein
MTEKLTGGRAAGMLDSEFDADDLEQAIKHEMEHTEDREAAKEIAKDHLIEDPDYYRKLAAIEQKSGLSMLPDEIVIGPAVGLSDDLALSYSAILEEQPVIDLMTAAGIQCKSATPCEAMLPDDSAAIYSLALVKSAKDRKTPDPLIFQYGDVGQFSKSIAEKRIIWYIAAEPGMPDMVDHRITAEEVEDQCHRFMLGPRLVFMEHGDERGLNRNGQWQKNLIGKAFVVESALLPCETATFMGEPLPRPAPMGSWFVAIYYKDAALWDALKNTPHGISWRGLAAKVVR